MLLREKKMTEYICCLFDPHKIDHLVNLSHRKTKSLYFPLSWFIIIPIQLGSAHLLTPRTLRLQNFKTNSQSPGVFKKDTVGGPIPTQCQGASSPSIFLFGWLGSLSFRTFDKKNTVPSGKLTCPLENWWLEDDPFPFRWSPFFRGHVKFRRCQFCFNQPHNHSHESQPLDFWNFASGERGERFPGRNENFDNPRVTVTEAEMEICHLVSAKKFTMLLGEWHCYIWVVRISIRKKKLQEVACM